MKIWNRYKDLAKEAKASAWYTMTNFFQKGISLIVVPLYIRLLSSAEYGEWSVFQAWRDILIIFASLNLYCGVYTKALVDNKEDGDRYTSCMQGLGTGITFLLLLFYIFTRSWCEKILGLDTPFMLLLFLYFIVYPAFSFWSTGQRVKYQYIPMVIVTLVITVLTPAISVLLILKTELRAKALILGYLSVQCAVGLFFYIYQFWKGRCLVHKEYWKAALKFNIPLIPHYLSLIVLGQSDRIMIKHYCGESDAGVYSLAYQIASAIYILETAISASRVPWTYEQIKNKAYGKIKNLANILTAMMMGIVFLIVLLCPEMIRIIGTKEYQDAMYVIPIVSLGIFYVFIYDLYASIEFYFGATKYVMYASVTGALLNLGLNAVFIPVFGFIAAAYTTSICYFVFMVMHYIFSARVLRKYEIKEGIYDNKKIFGFAILCTIIVLSELFTFQYGFLRLVLTVGIIAYFVLKRDILIDMLTAIKK